MNPVSPSMNPVSTSFKQVSTSMTKFLPVWTQYLPVWAQYLPVWAQYLPVLTQYLPVSTRTSQVSTWTNPVIAQYVPSTNPVWTRYLTGRKNGAVLKKIFWQSKKFSTSCRIYPASSSFMQLVPSMLQFLPSMNPVWAQFVHFSCSIVIRATNGFHIRESGTLA